MVRDREDVEKSVKMLGLAHHTLAPTSTVRDQEMAELGWTSLAELMEQRRRLIRQDAIEDCEASERARSTLAEMV